MDDDIINPNKISGEISNEIYNETFKEENNILNLENNTLDLSDILLTKEKKMSLLIVVLLQIIFNDKSNKLDKIYSFLNKNSLIELDVIENKYSNIRNNLTFLIESLNSLSSTNNEILETSISYEITKTNVNKFSTNFNQLVILGNGAYGICYKVFHKFEKKYYAIKKIFITPDIVADGYEIFREIQLYCNIEHPNIVKYYSSWVDIDVSSIIEFNKQQYLLGEDTINSICPTLFIQMELCDRNLREYILSYGIDDILDNKINFFKQIIQGVKYLHEQNIIHRDIKPDNIFISNGIAKIGDFGLSKMINNTFNTDSYKVLQLEHDNNKIISYNNMSENVGTGIYIAPEIDTGSYNKSIDIYALGILFIELLLNITTNHQKIIIISNIKNCPIIINNPEISCFLITTKYNDIIIKMIDNNPACRLTILELETLFIL